jgi:hypothetical protein
MRARTKRSAKAPRRWSGGLARNAGKSMSAALLSARRRWRRFERKSQGRHNFCGKKTASPPQIRTKCNILFAKSLQSRAAGPVALARSCALPYMNAHSR